MRSVVFWVITQRVVLIPYRRFGKTFWYHLQGPKSPRSVAFLAFKKRLQNVQDMKKEAMA